MIEGFDDPDIHIAVINGDNDIVRPQTRDRVMDAVQQLGYERNAVAGSLRSERNYMLALSIPDITNPFCSRVVQGIEAEAELHGYHILLCNSASQLQREAAYLSLLTGKVVDGVITMDAASGLQDLQALIAGAPWVQCFEFDPDIPASATS